MSLLFKSVDQYSSSIYETACGLLRSRTNQAERAYRLTQQNAVLKERCGQLDNQLAQTQGKQGNSTDLTKNCGGVRREVSNYSCLL